MVEPTIGPGGGALEHATGRRHSGGLRRLGGNPGGVSVVGPRGGHLGAGACAALGLQCRGMRCHRMVLCVQDSTELDYTAQPGITGLGPLSYLRQHGLYVHPTLTVTPDGVPLGVLDVWMWACDRTTFGEDQRHWPIEAEESMRWLESFERCAEWAVTLPDTCLVYVADRECDIRKFMVQARRQPQVDWLIRAAQDRKLAEGDRLWERLAQAPVQGEVTFTGPAEPTEPAGGADSAGRTSDPASPGPRTDDGDRAAGARRARARQGRTARLARLPTNRLAATGAQAAGLQRPVISPEECNWPPLSTLIQPVDVWNREPQSSGKGCKKSEHLPSLLRLPVPCMRGMDKFVTDVTQSLSSSTIFQRMKQNRLDLYTDYLSV